MNTQYSADVVTRFYNNTWSAELTVTRTIFDDSDTTCEPEFVDFDTDFITSDTSGASTEEEAILGLCDTVQVWVKTGTYVPVKFDDFGFTTLADRVLNASGSEDDCWFSYTLDTFTVDEDILNRLITA